MSFLMRILILDAYNLILRSYFGLPPGVDDQGRTNHAIRGWYATWLKLRRVFEPDRVIAVFDGGTDRQRKLLHPEYKTGRGAKPRDLIEQIQAIYTSCSLASITTVLQHHTEADDLIYTLVKTKKENDEMFVVSDDKDLAQCVTDSGRIRLYRPSTEQTWYESDVQLNFGVMPAQIDSFLALCGDPVDKIPGIPRIGKLTAIKLLRQYPDIHTALRTHPKYAPRYHVDLEALAGKMLELTRLKLVPEFLEFHHETEPAISFANPDLLSNTSPTNSLIEFLTERRLHRIVQQIHDSNLI
jgi:DNA polymerase-1